MTEDHSECGIVKSGLNEKEPVTAEKLSGKFEGSLG